jgi:hypothetical protein
MVLNNFSRAVKGAKSERLEPLRDVFQPCQQSDTPLTPSGVFFFRAPSMGALLRVQVPSRAGHSE